MEIFSEIFSEIYAYAVILVWILFSVVWFKMKVDAGGFWEGIFAYICISVAIFMGGIVIGALVMSDPGLRLGGILIAAAAIVVFVVDSNGYKNKQMMKSVKTYERAESVSSEELLKKLYSLEKGQVIRFGVYEWRVLSVRKDKALLFANQIVGIRKFNPKNPATWENCQLRKYLNSTFLNSFSASEQALIVETAVKNYNKSYGYFQQEEKPEPLRDTTDKIFVLSGGEAKRYIPKKQRELMINGEYIYWWLRDTCIKDSFSSNCVGINGELEDASADMKYGVRPAMWVKIK